MSDKTESNRAFSAYTAFVSLVGLGVCIVEARSLRFGALDWELLTIAAIGIVVGSSVAVGIRRSRLSVSLSDIFTYLVFLLYGPAPAVLLSAIEAFFSSGRYTKKYELRAFNASVMAISFFAAFRGAEAILGPPGPISGLTIGSLETVLAASIGHYLVNTVLIATSSALRTGTVLARVWKADYAWMFVPFVASGSIALVAAVLINTAGFISFLIVLPIVGVLYFTYAGHHEKLEAVTAQAEQAEKHLKEMSESEERFRSAFANAPIGIGILSVQGNWLQVNSALCEIFGYDEAGFREKDLRELVYPEDVVECLNGIGNLVSQRSKAYQAELRYFDSYGKEIWTQTSISWLSGPENGRLICQIQDITARRKAEEKLKHDAFIDSLTELWNHNYFLTCVTDAIARFRSGGVRFAVVFIDLDRFKLVNDSLGHRIGDQLLVAVARRLRRCVPKSCPVARFGSDEFFVLIDEETIEKGLDPMMEEIQSQVGLVYSIGGHEIRIRASIGAAISHFAHAASDDVLRDADTALQLAKREGRGRTVLFNDEMRAESIHQVMLEKELHGSLDRGELRLVYQPIVDVSTRGVTGFEALLRWRHPELGDIPPAEFIPIAEETGFIVKLGSFVLDTACRQLNAWRHRFGNDLRLTMAVNLSARQILQKSLIGDVLDTLDRYQIPPEWLKLEITEGVIVENTDVIMTTLKQLRAMGVTLSLDDFGTGYSSLSYLHRLPLNTLKIDRSFVSQMLRKAESAEIVKTIIVLAKNLNLETVAEGIETEEQAEALIRLGCDYGQGYLFSKPLESGDAANLVDKETGNPHRPHPIMTSEDVRPA